ncbi:MAG TPA: hypothetical protein VNO30_39585 [Kofleriaceae bacterium]|nr:hypothetical protein [Kofleriaceae bacterium]
MSDARPGPGEHDRARPALRPPRPRPIDVVVDGTDGAGKTACVRFLVDRWTRRGLAVASHAPYREQEVYPLWGAEPERAAQIITGIMARFRAAHASTDVVVWDRGWPTAFVTTADLRARAAFEPLPPLTVLLLSSTDRTRAKARDWDLRGVWVRDDALIEHYNATYHALDALGAPSDRKLLRAVPDASGNFDFEHIAHELDPELEALVGQCY